jgi:hypothetical protein
MKYRLALKLAGVLTEDGQRTAQAALGWAVIRLKDKPMQTTGEGPLPYDQIANATEARIVVYADPAEMLEAMPLASFEAKLKVLEGTLPEACKVVRVPFDGPAYTAWRAARADSHSLRAEWANTVAR